MKKERDYEKIKEFAQTFIDYDFFKRNPGFTLLASMKDESEEDGQIDLCLKEIGNEIIATPWDELTTERQLELRDFIEKGCPGLYDEDDEDDSLGFALNALIDHENNNNIALDIAFNSVVNSHGKDSGRGKHLMENKEQYIKSLK